MGPSPPHGRKLDHWDHVSFSLSLTSHHEVSTFLSHIYPPQSTVLSHAQRQQDRGYKLKPGAEFNISSYVRVFSGILSHPEKANIKRNKKKR